ncbi:MAG: two-component sensor histidine kinase [Candidatus Cloacimonadota bacterium]|nr:MAG: two-component sensor histidine kinase [Candidatus Cloacimonadota bacterium]PIE77702.1 MAG: two-component sensor histidine kinase [Candidatus Delongbacteria bacterium]
MDNHLERPEVRSLKNKRFGSNIRKSGTTNIYYYYYIKKYDSYFVRAALPYTEKVEDFLKADYYFILFILLLFIITSFLLIYVSDHFGKTISNLKKIAFKASNNEKLDDIVFEDNELGEIGKEIKKIYNKMSTTTKQLSLERDRLANFFNTSRGGVGIFSKEKKMIISNNHFINYINLISQEKLDSQDSFFYKREFLDIKTFLDNSLKEKQKNSSKSFNLFSNNRYFLFQVTLLNDLSFEITINDITEVENEKKLKQKMTSNIAHELKTPVSAILGYMETILNNSDLEKYQLNLFIEKSFKQAKRLSNLIQDISIITKIDEAKNLFEIKRVNLHTIIKEIIFDFDYTLKLNDITIDTNVDKNYFIEGNKFLLDSIFRNLIDNSIKYAGKFTKIKIDMYFKDDGYYYFSYSDNGKGIPQKSLSKIFERFYRIDKGRDRRVGGTGLGLSIVKHSVEFHKGNILAKSEINKGVIFNFSLKK